MGAKKEPATTTQTNKVELSPEQQEIFQYLKPVAQQAAQTEYKPYAGTTVAGFTPEEQLAQQNFMTQAGNVGGQATAAANANKFLMDPSILNPDSNPYLKSVGMDMATQIGDNFSRVIMPNLRMGDAVASGMYSGGNTKAGQAQGLAAGEAGKAISSSLNKLYSDAYTTGLGTMTNAVAANPSVIASQLVAPSVQGAVGEQKRAMEQAKLDAAAGQYYFNMFAPMMRANDIAGLIGTLPGGAGVSTVTGAQPQSGGIKSALGGAASGAAIGSMIPGIGTAIGAGLGGLAGFFS